MTMTRGIGAQGLAWNLMQGCNPVLPGHRGVSELAHVRNWVHYKLALSWSSLFSVFGWDSLFGGRFLTIRIVPVEASGATLHVRDRKLPRTMCTQTARQSKFWWQNHIAGPEGTDMTPNLYNKRSRICRSLHRKYVTVPGVFIEM